MSQRDPWREAWSALGLVVAAGGIAAFFMWLGWLARQKLANGAPPAGSLTGLDGLGTSTASSSWTPAALPRALPPAVDLETQRGPVLSDTEEDLAKYPSYAAPSLENTFSVPTTAPVRIMKGVRRPPWYRRVVISADQNIRVGINSNQLSSVHGFFIPSGIEPVVIPFLLPPTYDLYALALTQTANVSVAFSPVPNGAKTFR